MLSNTCYTCGASSGRLEGCSPIFQSNQAFIAKEARHPPLGIPHRLRKSSLALDAFQLFDTQARGWHMTGCHHRRHMLETEAIHFKTTSLHPRWHGATQPQRQVVDLLGILFLQPSANCGWQVGSHCHCWQVTKMSPCAKSAGTCLQRAKAFRFRKGILLNRLMVSAVRDFTNKPHGTWHISCPTRCRLAQGPGKALKVSQIPTWCHLDTEHLKNALSQAMPRYNDLSPQLPLSMTRGFKLSFQHADLCPGPSRQVPRL